MYWKCVPNISHHCSGLSVLTNICIGFGEYCGWTLGKTQENISALFHMHVGLLKCMNHRLWNLSSPATWVFVQKVVRATIKDTWKSACRKCFNFDGLAQERRNSSALEMELGAYVFLAPTHRPHKIIMHENRQCKFSATHTFKFQSIIYHS